MTNEEIVTRVNELMHRGFEIPMDKLVPEATLFEDLGLDSLDAVDMLVHLEENLGVKVAVERLAQVRTLENVYSLIQDIASDAPAAAQAPVASAGVISAAPRTSSPELRP